MTISLVSTCLLLWQQYIKILSGQSTYLYVRLAEMTAVGLHQPFSAAGGAVNFFRIILNISTYNILLLLNVPRTLPTPLSYLACFSYDTEAFYSCYKIEVYCRVQKYCLSARLRVSLDSIFREFSGLSSHLLHGYL